MNLTITKSIFLILSRLIWFGIIFFVVVHAVQFFDPRNQPGPDQLRLNLYLDGSISVVDLIALYWPKEIIIAIFVFILFEAVCSKSAANHAAKIFGKFLKAAPLEPLDFDLEIETELCKPGLATIEIKNDDKTPMEFVVQVLEEYFSFDRNEAVKLMLEVHTKGAGKIQWINADTASKVVGKISQEANIRSYPLECTIVLA